MPPERFRTHFKVHPFKKITLLVPVEVNICKWLAVIDGKDTEEAFACPHVLVSHGTVLLLSSCIQYVQQTGLTIYNHLFSVRILVAWGVRGGRGEREIPLLFKTAGNAMLLPRLNKLRNKSISVSGLSLKLLIYNHKQKVLNVSLGKKSPILCMPAERKMWTLFQEKMKKVGNFKRQLYCSQTRD